MTRSFEHYIRRTLCHQSHGYCDQTGSPWTRLTTQGRKDGSGPFHWLLTITLRAYLALLDRHRWTEVPTCRLVCCGQMGQLKQRRERQTLLSRVGGLQAKGRTEWPAKIQDTKFGGHTNTLLLGRKVMTSLDSILKSRDITLPMKVRLVKAMVFPVVMYGCESWTIKKAEHWRIDAFELWLWRRLLRVPWTNKEIQPVHPKGNQSWIFIGRTDVEGKTPILWSPDVKNWLIWKDPDAGKDWRQEEKRTTEDKMVGWHHQLNGHEFG